MKLISVDVESDGPLDGKHSMVCFGAVVVDDKLDKTFYGQTAPIVQTYDPEALAISGFTREEHEKFDNPADVMHRFYEWVRAQGRSVFVADNPGYDFAWINYYFYRYVGKNPFGWSSRRIGDLWCGYENDPYFKWKKYRKTKHSHNPVDDAKGNAEAIIALRDKGFNIKL